MEIDNYTTPSMVEFGSIVELTRGDGTSSIWDMGAGRKEECSDCSDDNDGDPLNQGG